MFSVKGASIEQPSPSAANPMTALISIFRASTFLIA
jgi:hypothetical protein